MARYRVDNPGCPTDFPVVGNCDSGAEAVKRVGVAYELVPPPADWTEDQPPTHAIEVTRRNGGSTYGSRDSGAGRSAKTSRCTSRSGTIYIAGGSGLSAGQAIDPNPQEIPDPVAPPSRCGRRILILVDQSGSISNAGAQQTVKDAVTSFVQGFQGTPGQIAVERLRQRRQGHLGPVRHVPRHAQQRRSAQHHLVDTTVQNSHVQRVDELACRYPVVVRHPHIEWRPRIPRLRTRHGGVHQRRRSDATPHATGQSSDSPGINAYNHHASFAATSANLARELGVQDVIGVLVGDPSSASVIDSPPSWAAPSGTANSPATPKSPTTSQGASASSAASSSRSRHASAAVP